MIDLTQSDMPVDSEFKEYLLEPVRVSNPLEWWVQYEHKFPKISKLAQTYLAIPATSVPSERTFSAAGLTVTKLRASLDPDTVDKIIFLKKCQKIKVKLYLESIGKPANVVNPEVSVSNVLKQAEPVPPVLTVPPVAQIVKAEQNMPALPGLPDEI